MNIAYSLIKVDGYNIFYLSSGTLKDKVVVLLHGIGGSSHRWIDIIPLLAKEFYVIAPDIIGFGYSDKPNDVDYSMEFFVEFMFKFLKGLDLIGKDITLVGSSFGGHIAAEFAIRYPNLLSHLVLVDPAGTLDRITPAFNEYILAAMYPNIDNALKAFRYMIEDERYIDLDYVKNFVNIMRSPNAKYPFLASLMGSRRSILKDRLDKIKVKSLIIWGEKDKIIPLRYINEFKKIPNSKVIIMRCVGHLPFVEKKEEFAKIVTNFILFDTT